MSFLKKLFGIGGSAAGAAPAEAAVEHDGFMIRATPIKEGGEFQVCGVITREIGGELREYRFIRVDRFTDRSATVDLTLQKARQIIAEQGERMFS